MNTFGEKVSVPLIIMQKKARCAVTAYANMRGKLIDSIDGAKSSAIRYSINRNSEGE